MTFIRWSLSWGARRVRTRQWQCFWFFVDPFTWSLGISVDVRGPNLEVHLPMGFFKIGWVITYQVVSAMGYVTTDPRGVYMRELEVENTKLRAELGRGGP